MLAWCFLGAHWWCSGPKQQILWAGSVFNDETHWEDRYVTFIAYLFQLGAHSSGAREVQAIQAGKLTSRAATPTAWPSPRWPGWWPPSPATSGFPSSACGTGMPTCCWWRSRRAGRRRWSTVGALAETASASTWSVFSLEMNTSTWWAKSWRPTPRRCVQTPLVWSDFLAEKQPDVKVAVCSFYKNKLWKKKTIKHLHPLPVHKR